MKNLILCLVLAFSFSAYGAPKPQTYQAGSTLRVTPLDGILLNGSQSIETPSATITTGDLLLEDGNIDVGVGGITVGGGVTAANFNGGNLAGDNSGDVTISTVGSSPNANGASLSGQELKLQPANGSNPGILTAGTQSIGGDKTFEDTITASNLSGTNTGDQDLSGYVLTDSNATLNALTLANSSPLKGRNFLDSADIDLISVNADDQTQIHGNNIRLNEIIFDKGGPDTTIYPVGDSAADATPPNPVIYRGAVKSAGTGKGGDIQIKGGDSFGGPGGDTILGGSVGVGTGKVRALSALVLPNAVPLQGRNLADSADIDLISATDADTVKVHGNLVRIVDMFHERNGGINNDIYAASEDTADANPAGTLTYQASYKSSGTGDGGNLQHLGGDSFGGDGGDVIVKGGLGVNQGQVLLQSFIVNDFIYGADKYPTIYTPDGVFAGSTVGYGIDLYTGNVSGAGETGGEFYASAGLSSAGTGGTMYLYSGPGGTQGGDWKAAAGDGYAPNGAGGDVSLKSGVGIGTGAAGKIDIVVGASSVAGADLNLYAGDGATGGNILLQPGSGTPSGYVNVNGGDLRVQETIRPEGGIVQPTIHATDGVALFVAAGSSEAGGNSGGGLSLAGGEVISSGFAPAQLALDPGTSSTAGAAVMTATEFSVSTGDIEVSTAGKGLNIAEGSNARMGTCTLVAGTCTVSTTVVTADSRIMITGQNSSGTHGEIGISARTASTSFTITSTSALDTRLVAWIIFEPAN